MQRDTRHFARRQRTWLRKVEGVHWINPADSEQLTSLVAEFLNTG